MHNKLEALQIDDVLLYHFKSLNEAQLNYKEQMKIESGAFYYLLIPQRNKVTVLTEHDAYTLQSGTAFICHPNQSFQLYSDIEEDIFSYWLLRFSVIQMCDGVPQLYKGQLTPSGDGPLLKCPLTRVLRLLKQVGHSEPFHENMSKQQEQLSFHELMVQLLYENTSVEKSSELKLVEETITFMENQFSEPLTVRQLAQKAGIAQHQYTLLFQELTGKKPLEYLNELRIEQSKAWLRNSDMTLREIARRVGFCDEYYFNRRFRQLTGLTPRKYTLAARDHFDYRDWVGRKVQVPSKPARIVFHGETFGDLIALGVRPIGGSVFWRQEHLFNELIHPVSDVGFPLDEIKLSKLKPDLIIMSTMDRKQYDQAAEIAPTVTFDSFAPIDKRLRRLGDLLNIGHSVDSWLGSYHMRLNRMWNHLKSYVGSKESASVFIYTRGGRLFVMGRQGLSATLYHESGFQVPKGIQQIIDSGLSFKEITTAEIKEFAGDRIFMLITREVSSQNAAYKLKNSDTWQELPAVRAGHDYWLEDEEWNYGDAYTSNRIIETLPELLGKSKMLTF